MADHEHEGDIQELIEIRELLLQSVAGHDEEIHDGDACVEHRIGAIAFLAHSIGLKPAHFAYVAEAVRDYEIQHLARAQGNGHHDH